MDCATWTKKPSSVVDRPSGPAESGNNEPDSATSISREEKKREKERHWPRRMSSMSIRRHNTTRHERHWQMFRSRLELAVGADSSSIQLSMWIYKRQNKTCQLMDVRRIHFRFHLNSATLAEVEEKRASFPAVAREEKKRRKRKSKLQLVPRARETLSRMEMIET